MSKFIKEYCWRQISSDGLVKYPEEGLLCCALTHYGHESEQEAEEELARYYAGGGSGKFVLLVTYREGYSND